jgi:GntR family transcriptional regulator
MLTRNPTLTEQVRAHIKELILQGAFEDGRIPGEQDLAAELGVSRTTVRDALARLENEGAVLRRQGSGTYVNEPGLQIKSRLEEIWSYEEVLRNHGFTPSVSILGITTGVAGEDAAAALEIEADAEVTMIRKLFLADEEPVIYTCNRIPGRYLDADIAEADKEPLFTFLREHAGRQPAYYLTEIAPVAMPDQAAAALQIDPGTPTICFDEVLFDTLSQPIAHARSYFRDDLLRFRVIRRRADA